jgi:hypothetical protein
MVYANDIIEPLRAHLAKLKDKYIKALKLPSDRVMSTLFEVAYHASFLTEEGRKLHFRIIFGSEEELSSKDRYRGRLTPRPIVFDAPRDFSVSEILRLAPALDMTQVLICVSQTNRSETNPKLGIWGLLNSGSSWWHFMHHESSHGMPPPNYLTVSCSEPGHISISAQGRIFMTLRNGILSEPSWGALYDGPLGKFFDPARRRFHKEVLKGLGTDKYDPEGHDEDYPQRVYTFFIERLLFHIREKAHGGTVFFVPDYLTHKDTRLLDRVDIKYPINYDEVWNLLKDDVIVNRKYYDLFFPLSDGKDLIKERLNEMSLLDSQRDEIEEATGDCVRFVAGLSGVDGAVIITDRFRVLGFGGEVLVHSPNLTEVMLPGSKKKLIADYGTRHRSAFRFCSSFEEGVGFIVSTDGGVKATMRTGAEVALWPDINVGVFGI